MIGPIAAVAVVAAVIVIVVVVAAFGVATAIAEVEAEALALAAVAADSMVLVVGALVGASVGSFAVAAGRDTSLDRRLPTRNSARLS